MIGFDESIVKYLARIDQCDECHNIFSSRSDSAVPTLRGKDVNRCDHKAPVTSSSEEDMKSASN